ncbi:DNA-binding protein [Viridothelium virens]|uniref:DNA-binding protein n=1 Tax=Viridothelium virens TaxID=1048519 RepID=A0A6A6HLE0_VIRVR|nr:DNA-binding protein [Viridothelium virens]
MSTFAALASSFIDFLTVAIHTILYERGLYPSETFLSAHKYHYAVRQSRHPRVCAWIQAAASAVEAELLKGTIAHVALVIFSPSSEPLERFMFDLSRLPEVPPDEINTPFERVGVPESLSQSTDKGATPSPHVAPPPDLSVNLEEQFRATMARLSTCGSRLSPLPPDCTYTVVIENKRDVPPPIDHPQPWIPVEPRLQSERSKGKRNFAGLDEDDTQGEDWTSDRLASEPGRARTLPIRAVKAGEMIFEVWAEEGKSKNAILAGSSAGHN